MAGSTSNLKVVGPVQNIGGGGGLNIIGKYPDDIDKAKPGDALIDENGNIWIYDGNTWVQVDAVKGEDGKDGTDGVDGKDGVGVPEGGQDGQVLIKEGTEDFETKWGDAEFSSDSGNLVELNPIRKALRKPKDGEEIALPLGKVVMYVGNGLPSDWPEITNAKVGSLFTSTTGDGFFFRDNDGWDLVGGSESINTDDFLTADDLDGLATEEYVNEALANIEFPDGGGSFFGENPPTEDLKEGYLFISSDTYRQYVYDGSVWVEISPAGADDFDIEEILKTLNPFVDVTPASITGELSRIYRGSKTSTAYLSSGINFKSNTIGQSQYRFDVDVLGDGNWVDYEDLPSDTKSELVLSRSGSGNNISFTVRIADHGGDINDPSTYPQPAYENVLIRYWAKNVVNDREELVVSEGVSPWVVNHVQYPDVYPDEGGA